MHVPKTQSAMTRGLRSFESTIFMLMKTSTVLDMMRSQMYATQKLCAGGDNVCDITKEVKGKL